MLKGIDKLRASVMADCQRGKNCFSENGCTAAHHNGCSHAYCDKYKWVLDRAAHYAEKAGKTTNEVIEIWETDRSYWYMNYYQECNQPLLTSESIINYDDWILELKARFGDDPKQWAFVCPSCGNVQTIQHFIDHGLKGLADNVYYHCIGRYVKNIGCDWTLGGLLKINKVSVMRNAQVFPVFEMADAVLPQTTVK
jgi:hypothetical protein